jgi:SMI1 / KNR4 family (SUKH-1)
MTSTEWRTFLEEFSRELLAPESIRRGLPEAVIATGWMGFEPASEAQIVTLETRLCVRLPPSYRTFLGVTNGWRATGPFIHRLWSTDDVTWFRERSQDWIDAYVQPWREMVQDLDQEELDDAENPEHLQTALEVSDRGDSAIYLLIPDLVTSDGEWEAWDFANWHPGAVRYPSFTELMRNARDGFMSLRQSHPQQIEQSPSVPWGPEQQQMVQRVKEIMMSGSPSYPELQNLVNLAPTIQGFF